MRQTIKTLSVVLLGAATLLPTGARAWDEDTCSAGSEINPDGTPVDAAYCASATPLEGKHPDIPFDHSVSHFEFTYLVGRCVGRGDSDARRLAAADAGTDMSSPACGSGAVDNNATSNGGYEGQFYYAGYACGYELDENAATATLPAVPVLDAATEGAGQDGVLRWKHTDRCRSSRQADGTGVHGHGEFFHYPYWAVTDTTNSLASLRAWARGSTTTLPDPSDINSANCDLGASTGGCAFSWPLEYLRPGPKTSTWEELEDINGEPLCSWSKSTEWVMPTAQTAGDAWDKDVGRAYRFGVYLHALGDYHSHSLCQLYSGQPTNDDSFGGAIIVPISDAGPTDHADFGDRCPDGGIEYMIDGKPVLFSQAECHEVCALAAHDAEYGAESTSSVAAQALSEATKTGLKAVWDEIARYPDWATTRDVEATAWLRDQVVENFADFYDPADRQVFVASVMNRGGSVAMGETADSPCLCPNGVYDWVERKVVKAGTKSTVIPGHCASPKSIVLSTSAKETATATPSMTVAVGATVRLYAWAPSTRIGSSTPTENRHVSGSSDWVVANTATATVNNTYGSSTIGTITGVKAGTTTVLVTRLGMASEKVTITVK